MLRKIGMTTSQLESSWSALKGKLKQKYGQLTDDDLIFAEGKGEELLSRLEEKLSLSREELQTMLDELAAGTEGKLEGVKAAVAEISDQVRAKAGDVVDDLKHKASAIGEEAKAQGAAAYSEAQRRARGLWEDGEEYVRANPRESLLVAVAAGFVAGLLLFRR